MNSSGVGVVETGFNSCLKELGECANDRLAISGNKHQKWKDRQGVKRLSELEIMVFLMAIVGSFIGLGCGPGRVLISLMELQFY